MAAPETASASASASTPMTTPAIPLSTKGKKLSPEELTAYISDPRFNQIFQLPADPSRGRPEPFQVSYADIGFRREDASSGSNEEEQVLLFFGPLFSSRFFKATKDELAKKYKVRLVNPERPGIGKTDRVPVEKRLEIWREAIPALLDHLGIKRVSIACHSGGTVFALDFAVHFPQYLNPSRPYIAFGAPWVNVKHSSVFMMEVASSLPRSVMAQAGSAASFVNTKLGPVIGVSAVVSGSVLQLWSQAKPSGREGPDVAFEESVRDDMMKHVFKGDTHGVGDEVQVLLRKGIEETGWSDWGDFDVVVPRLADAVRSATGANLKVDVFLAEKDNMIGDVGSKGPKWFESCWTDVEGIDFTSETVMGTDHDHAWDLRWDVLEKVLKTMTGAT